MDSIAAAAILVEEEECSQRKYLKMERRALRESYNPFSLDDREFLKSFRLNKVAFKYVLDVVEEAIWPCFNQGVSELGHLVCTLRLLAEGGFQHGVGSKSSIGLAQPTTSKILQRCLNIMEDKLCSQWIKLDMSSAEMHESNLEFRHRTKFPGVVMCVGGSHVKIIAPPEKKPLYFNQNDYYSLNAMLLCDSKKRIRYIDASSPGSIHNSHIWNSSDARKYFENKYKQGERGTYILGDADYPLEPWLMTPFHAPANGSPESVYNKIHAETRNIMAKTIGILKHRFRCLLGVRHLHYSPQKTAQIIKVCCALHNICIHYGVVEPNVEIEEDEGSEFVAEENDANITNEAITIRQSIVNNL